MASKTVIRPICLLTHMSNTLNLSRVIYAYRRPNLLNVRLRLNQKWAQDALESVHRGILYVVHTSKKCLCTQDLVEFYQALQCGPGKEKFSNIMDDLFFKKYIDLQKSNETKA